MNAAGTNMNCEQYKEAIAADPSESFDGGALHSAECSSCNSYSFPRRSCCRSFTNFLLKLDSATRRRNAAVRRVRRNLVEGN